jgi:hypothetical protein
MLNVDAASTPLPPTLAALSLSREGEREAKPLSLDRREVGERVLVKHSP